MRDSQRTFRGPLLVAVLLGLPFIFLWANARDAESANLLQRGVQWLSAPVQQALMAVYGRGVDLVDDYVWLRGVEQRNAALAAQVGGLKRRVQSLEEAERENQRLRRLLTVRDATPGSRLIAASVIGYGQSSSYRTLRIDRGESDGVRRRAGVVAADGAVGRVIAASSHWADVLLLADAGARVDVIAARSRAQGMVRGGGAGSACRIEAMDRTADLREGDVLLTSGLDGLFMKGIPVARVTRVTRPRMGLYLDAEAEPYVDFGRLEEVLVVVQPAAEVRWPHAPSTTTGPSSAPTEACPPPPTCADEATQPAVEHATEAERCEAPMGNGHAAKPTSVTAAHVAPAPVAPRPASASAPALPAPPVARPPVAAPLAKPAAPASRPAVLSVDPAPGLAKPATAVTSQPTSRPVARPQREDGGTP